MLEHELLQLRNELGVAAEREVRSDSLLEHHEANLLQPLDRPASEQLVRKVRQSLAAPEIERIAEESRGALCIARRLRLGGLRREPLEQCEIELLGSEADDVARRTRLDHRLRAERLPQLGDLTLHLLERRHGSGSRVEVVGDLIHGDHAVRVQKQDRERRPLSRTAEVDRAAFVHDVQRPQDPELEQFAGPYRFTPRPTPAGPSLELLRGRRRRLRRRRASALA